MYKKKLLLQAYIFLKFIFHRSQYILFQCIQITISFFCFQQVASANQTVNPVLVQIYQFFYDSSDFTQQIYTQTNFQILREYVYSSLTSYYQITTKQCGDYLHFLMSNNLLDLQFVKLQLNLPTHQWVQIQLKFYKTGQLGTEDFSVITDESEITYQQINDKSISCQDWQNYTFQQVSFQGPHQNKDFTIVIKSKANIDIRKWSIEQIKIQAFICPSKSYFDNLQCFQCIEGCEYCSNRQFAQL